MTPVVAVVLVAGLLLNAVIMLVQRRAARDHQRRTPIDGGER